MLLARLFENRCFDFAAVGRSTIIPSWSSTLAGFAVAVAAAVVVVEQAGHKAGLLPVSTCCCCPPQVSPSPECPSRSRIRS